MALSTRKKNTIVADWKTGKYPSFYAIAKHYKIDKKTAKKLLEGISKENAHIVEVLTMAESAKKSLKSPLELNAVEKAVKERLQVNRICSKVLDGIEGFIDGGKAQKVIVTGDIIEHDIQADDYKKLAEAVDKVSVTQVVNDRFSNSQVNIQNNNTNNQNLEQTGIKIEFIG